VSRSSWSLTRTGRGFACADIEGCSSRKFHDQSRIALLDDSIGRHQRRPGRTLNAFRRGWYTMPLFLRASDDLFKGSLSELWSPRFPFSRFSVCPRTPPRSLETQLSDLVDCRRVSLKCPTTHTCRAWFPLLTAACGSRFPHWEMSYRVRTWHVAATDVSCVL
jgi:hypothetical protein